MEKIFNLDKNIVDHLNFYLDNSVSPVRQNIKNLSNHYQRRESLYNKLGLTPSLLSKSRILEIAPGSGFNSLYTYSQNPKYFELVEPNLTACKDIKNLLFKKKNSKKNLKLNSIKIENFKPAIKYDIVLCECWIGSLKNEIEILKTFQNLLVKNGILVITFQPGIGMFANTLRKLISFKIINRNDNINTKVEKLSKAFSSHLKKLKHMSRFKRDWIIDVLINPATIGSYLSPETIFKALNKFEPLSTYPSFEDGWRWYKSLIKKEKTKIYLKDYYSNYLNFTDAAKKEKLINDSIGLKIDNEIFKFYNKILNYENSKLSYQTLIPKILKDLRKLYKALKDFNIENFNNMILETIDILGSKKVNIVKIAKLQYLSQIFGRELCYISLKKK